MRVRARVTCIVKPLACNQTVSPKTTAHCGISTKKYIKLLSGSMKSVSFSKFTFYVLIYWKVEVFFYKLRQFCQFCFLVEFESVQNSFLYFVIQPEHLLVSNGWIMLTGFFAMKIKVHQSVGSVVVGFPASPWSNC